MRYRLIPFALLFFMIACENTQDTEEEPLVEEYEYTLDELEGIYQDAKSAYGVEDYQAAFSFYEEANDYADNLAEQGIYSNLKHLSLFELGTINAYHNHYYEGAIDYYKKSIEIDEEKYGECTWRIPALNNIAHCYYQVSDFDSSIASSEKILTYESNNTAALTNICYCYGNMGYWDLGMTYCDEAARLGNESAKQWLEKYQ